MPFSLRTSTAPGASVVSPSGDLDVYASGPLREALAELAADGSSDIVVVDLAGTDFIDSSVLGVLVGAVKQLEPAGRRLALVCTKPHLLKIFHITRLSDVITIYDSVAAATR